MGVGRATRTLGTVVTAIALFPPQAGVAQQLPSVPSVPPTPTLPPAPNLPPTPVEPPSTPSLPAPDASVPEVLTPQLPATPSTPKLLSTGVGTDGLPVPGYTSGQPSHPGSAAGQASVHGQAPSGGQNGSPAGGSTASVARRRARLSPV